VISDLPKHTVRKSASIWYNQQVSDAGDLSRAD
jgi:hypothetical protein